MGTNSKAFKQGLKDGVEDVRDAGATAEDVEGWFAAGHLSPDEALINAMGSDDLAKEWGVENGSEAWSAALDQYNAGYRTGARQQVRGDGGLTDSECREETESSRDV
jgi:hypothetical protein